MRRYVCLFVMNADFNFIRLYFLDSKLFFNINYKLSLCNKQNIKLILR